jgi:hypothetical protein
LAPTPDIEVSYVQNSSNNPLSSSLILDVWDRELQGDPDRDFLLEGVRSGFHIIDREAALHTASMNNYKSATDRSVRGKVEAQIISEIEEGRYVVTSSKPTIVSALGAIPKAGTDEIRLIHDCSQPSGLAVNDYASLDEGTRYQSVQDAVRILKPGSFLAKVDLKSAYRSVPVHPSNWQALGLQWCFHGDLEPTFMYDTRLPFGSKLAPGIFHRLTQAVCRMLQRKGIRGIIVYLDDFLVVADSYEECLRALNALWGLLRCLGFAISWGKVEGPTQAITFLGIRIDSVAFTLELPEPKLEDLRSCINSFQGRKRASLHSLQQLAGKLNWACQVVRGGRTYLRRVLDVIKPLRKSHHKAKLSAEFHSDLEWWSSFLAVFNGKYLAFNYSRTNDVFMDACTVGAGIASGDDWQYVHWDSDMPDVAAWHINSKETLCAVLAARRWAPLWANSRVRFFTDNICTRANLVKGTAKNSLLMPFIRELFWLSAIYNFEISAVYVPGRCNDLPDAISRLHQDGQVTRLGSIFGIPTVICGFWVSHCFPVHMSRNALFAIFSQIQGVIQMSYSWIRRWPHLGLMPLPHPPSRLTPPIVNHI